MVGGATVLGKFSVPGRPTNLENGRARAYCACSRCGSGMFGHFFSRLWEMARYIMKYCLKASLNQNNHTVRVCHRPILDVSWMSLI